MKKSVKIFFLTIGVISILLYVAKQTGAIQFAFVPSAGNEPNVKLHSFIFASNLIPVKKYKYVLYNQVNPHYDKGIYMQRLVGVEGDKVQIKDGDLYVNDKMIDNNFKLNHSYIIDRGFMNDLLFLKKRRAIDIYQITGNDFVAQLSKNDLDESHSYKRYISTKPDSSIVSAFGHDWNADNFGPIRVPKYKIFTLGDNRNASLDARYLGFIDVENIKGIAFYPIN